MKRFQRFTKANRIIAFFLVMMMVFTACGKADNNTGATNADSANTDSSSTVSNAGTGSNTNAGSNADAGSLDTDGTAGTPAMEDTTIKIRVMNDYGVIEPILAAYEEQVKDDPIMSKIHLEFEYVAGADYKDKLSMSVSAQEDYDLMFCGSWHGLDNYIASGAFKDITSYFYDGEFEGLSAAFAKDFLDPCLTYTQAADGTWSAALYKIPLAETLYDIRGLAYREDLRVKYNIPEITNDEIMMQYVQAIAENEPDMIPLQMYNGFFYWESKYWEAAQNNIYTVEPVGQEASFWVAVNDAGTKVLDVAMMGDSAEYWANFPTGFNYDFVTEYQLDRLKWADYMDPVRGTSETSVGTPAVVYSTLTGFLAQQRDLAANDEVLSEYPDASLRFYPTTESQRNMEAGAIVSEMKSNNFLVVPEWSEKTDAVMYFLNWMYGSRENHDLFQYGIEGVNWEKTSDSTYEDLDANQPDIQYTMPGYSFTWNPTYVLYDGSIAADPELKAWYDYMLNSSSYTASKIAGFSFNTSDVETEVANVTALSGELLLRFALHGDETKAVIDEFNSYAKDVGLEDIRVELKQQVQDFLDMKNSLGK